MDDNTLIDIIDDQREDIRSIRGEIHRIIRFRITFAIVAFGILSIFVTVGPDEPEPPSEELSMLFRFYFFIYIFYIIVITAAVFIYYFHGLFLQSDFINNLMECNDRIQKVAI